MGARRGPNGDQAQMDREEWAIGPARALTEALRSKQATVRRLVREGGDTATVRRSLDEGGRYREARAELLDSDPEEFEAAAGGGDENAKAIVTLIEELDEIIALLDDLEAAQMEKAGQDEGLDPATEREITSIMAALGVGEDEARRILKSPDPAAAFEAARREE